MTTKVEKTITVNVPASTAYNQWTQFEDFPEFMGGVKHVEQLDDKRLHWVAEIGGVKREWYANILEQRPDEKIAWAATEGATNAGAVYFSPAGAGHTSVTLELEYEPEGVLERVADRFNIVEKQAESDLEKFKTFIESRNDETGAWRGEVEGQTVGTPGVQSAASSQGDSGKVGVSGAAAVAGVAAAAAGVAAAAAASRSADSNESQQSESSSERIVEETTFDTPTIAVTTLPDTGAPSAPAGAGEEEQTGGVELDSTTPGATDDNDGQPQGGTL